MTDAPRSLHVARESTPTPYLTIEEAARLARCNPKTIRRQVAAGELAAFRPAHRMLLRESDVRAWVESKSAAEPARRRPGRSHPRRQAPGSVAALRELDPELTR